MCLYRCSSDVYVACQKLAVENAKFQVDQTRANLEASREAYNTATEKLLQQQEQIGKTIADLTELDYP